MLTPQPPSMQDSMLELAALTPEKFFGMEPVIVEVNRSMERSLNKQPVLLATAEEEDDDAAEGPPLIRSKFSLFCEYRYPRKRP